MQKITFTTNVGKNTLAHLKLLLQSLKINLDSDEHEILIFIDSDNENILDYLLSIKSEFKNLKVIKNNLPVPVGYAVNKTILTEHATHDIISYLQSDMVVCPHYDTEILKYVKRGRILSSTRVEPPLHGPSSVTFTKNFGIHPKEFNIDEWNIFAESVKRDELIEYFFAPITYYKDDWMNMDGYDTLFRRSREDSDLVQRCLHAGIELVQTYSANVYHFTCVSSRGKDWFNKTNAEAQERLELQNRADIIELRRFIRKWGSFNHGEQKLHKLDIDVVFKNYTVSQVMELEPFFSRVWLEQDKDKIDILVKYNEEHDIANKLYAFSDEDWVNYKHLYRMNNFDSIINIGSPTSYSIMVTIDFKKVKQPNQFFSNIQNLYLLLKDCDVGTYELDGIIIDVHDTKAIPVDINVNNPSRQNLSITLY